MTNQQARKLLPGIYRIYWKGGGNSIAAVGVLHSGNRWFAPTNWTSPAPPGIASGNWKMVDDVESFVQFSENYPR